MPIAVHVTTVTGSVLRRSLRTALAVAALVAVAAPATASAALPDLIAFPEPSRPLVEDLTRDGQYMRVMRFNGFIHNAPGAGPLELRGTTNVEARMEDTIQRVFTTPLEYLDTQLASDLYYDMSDGHLHWHVRAAARYSLWAANGSALVAPAAKVGFCMTDSWNPDTNESVGPYATGCGHRDPTIASVAMGLSPGWVDIYGRGLWYQWVDISNVAPGTYLLRTDIDPDDIIDESDENNVPAQRPVKVPGWISHPVRATLARSGDTTVVLDADGVPEERDEGDPENDGNPDNGETPIMELGPVEYRIEDAPAHGTLSRAAGEWFSDATLAYTPAGEPVADSFTYSVREVGSPFPLSPPRSAVTLAVAPPEEPEQPTTVAPAGGDAPPPPPPPPPAESVTISGAPGLMFAGTSVRLSANLPVAWSATAGAITPDGVYTAPLTPGLVLVRAAAGDNVGEALISVVAAPERPALPRACSGRAVSSPIGRLCVRRVNGRLLVGTVPARAGRLRVVVKRGRKVVKRCTWTASAGRNYACRFRVASGPRLRVVVTQRGGGGKVLRKRLAVR